MILGVSLLCFCFSVFFFFLMLEKQYSQGSALGGSIGHHALTAADNVCVLGPHGHMGQFFHISLVCTGLPDISLPLFFLSARNIATLSGAHCRQGKASLSHRESLTQGSLQCNGQKETFPFSDTIHTEERSIAVKEYSLTVVGMLSNPMRHPKSLGHTWKVPMFGKKTQFHFLQWLHVYNPWTSAIASYFHFWSGKINFLFLLKSKLKSDLLRIFFLLARACCFPRHVMLYIFSTKLSHHVPTSHGLNFWRRFLLFLDYFWADISTPRCKAINLQLHSLLFGSLPRASQTTVSLSISTALDFSLK